MTKKNENNNYSEDFEETKKRKKEIEKDKKEEKAIQEQKAEELKEKLFESEKGIEINNVKKLEKNGIIIENLSDKVFINKLKLDDNDIKYIAENGLKTYSEITFFLNLKYSRNYEGLKEYIKRKKEYLEQNRTLSEDKFLELFINKGKYNKTEINQTGLGICYMYTGLEVLKKSNIFNELIQTNLKETEQGRELRLPMGDKYGKRIKVNRNEINKTYKYIGEQTGNEYEININAESKGIGFKILEIAFMKALIIYNYERKIRDNEYINKAKEEYQMTGDIKIKKELLTILDEKGGTIERFYKIIINNKRCNNTHLNAEELYNGINDKGKDLAFEYFKKGGIFITIGIEKEEFKNKELTKKCEITNEGIIVHDVKIINKDGHNYESRYEITHEGINDKRFSKDGKYIGNQNLRRDLITDINGQQVAYFFPDHVYSIEKCYIDKETQEKRVRVINPHFTGMKFDISLEECKKIFRRNLTCLNTFNAFKD